MLLAAMKWARWKWTTIYSEEEQDEKIKAALPTYHYKEPQPDDGSYITEDDVNVIITRGSVFEGGKYRIYNHFQQEKTEKETVAFLKKRVRHRRFLLDVC